MVATLKKVETRPLKTVIKNEKMKSKKFFVSLLVLATIFCATASAQTLPQSAQTLPQIGFRFEGYILKKIWANGQTSMQINTPNLVFEEGLLGIHSGTEPLGSLFTIGQGTIPWNAMYICMKSSWGNFAFNIKDGYSMIRTSQNLFIETNGKNVGIGIENPQRAVDINGDLGLTGFIRNTIWSGNSNRYAFYNPAGTIWASSVPILDGRLFKKNSDGTYNHKRYEMGVLIWDSTNNIPPTYIEALNTEYFKKAFSLLDDAEMEKRMMERVGQTMSDSEYQDLSSKKDFLVRIFPNPCKEEITVETCVGQVSDLSILDKMTSRVIKEKANSNTINTSDLKSGVYILKIFIKK